MKRGLLGLVSIICLLAVFFPLGAFTVSADETGYKELTTVDFTAGSTEIDGGVFDTLAKMGSAKAEAVSEDGETFARVTSTSKGYGGLYVTTPLDIPRQTYEVTITYRLNKGFKAYNKNFTFRFKNKNRDHYLFAHDDNYSSKIGVWTTETFTLTPYEAFQGFQIFAYMEDGSSFDIKEVKFGYKADVRFNEYNEFFGDKPKDVTVDFNLYGKTFDKVYYWDEDGSEELEVLDPSNYTLKMASTTHSTPLEELMASGSITFKKEYLSTLKDGRRGFVFELDGVKYATIVNILHSNVFDDPVSLKYTDLGEEEKSGYGLMIGAASAILLTVVIVGGVVVLKKKR